MRRILTRPPTRSPANRSLTTLARRRLCPERGEKGKLTCVYQASRPLMRHSFSGGGHVRRCRLLSHRQVDDRSGMKPRTSSLGPFLTASFDSRAIMSPDCSCETGTRGTSPGPTEVANGKRIWRMSGWCPGTWGYPVEWFVPDDSCILSQCSSSCASRSISPGNIGTTCSNPL